VVKGKARPMHCACHTQSPYPRHWNAQSLLSVPADGKDVSSRREAAPTQAAETLPGQRKNKRKKIHGTTDWIFISNAKCECLHAAVEGLQEETVGTPSRKATLGLPSVLSKTSKEKTQREAISPKCFNLRAWRGTRTHTE